MLTNEFPLKPALSGQVAIVTGAGRGIGRTTAQALAGAGAAVATIARTSSQVEETAALIDKAGGRAMVFSIDVTDAPAVEEMVAAVEDSLGPVDLLVNNAAIIGPLGPTWAADADAWWRCMDINVRGPLLCSNAVLPGMVKRKHGRIVTVSSGDGTGATVDASAYGVSKCAVISLCKTLAAETAPHGISVFSIHPGVVRTSMTESLLTTPEFGKIVEKLLADGVDVPPDRAADLILQLASGDLDTLSGRVISVQDDIDELIVQAE